jgi:hypothetical protein
MGTFHVKCKIENPTERSRAVVIPKLLVGTGSEFTWASERMLERIGIRCEKKDVRFVLANGQRLHGALALRLFVSTSISRSMRLFSPNPAIAGL